MYSKQEKLAAARKKLKEFQGKQRESDINKMKNISTSSDFSSKDVAWNLSSTFPSCSETRSDTFENKYLVDSFISKDAEHKDTKGNDTSKQIFLSENDGVNYCNTFPIKSEYFNNSSHIESSDDFLKVENTVSSHYVNGVLNTEIVPCAKKDSSNSEKSIESCVFKQEFCASYKNDINVPDTKTNISSTSQNNNFNPLDTNIKGFYGASFNANSTGQVMPSSTEIQTKDVLSLKISHLTDERNNLMEVLKRTEELLKYKTEQEENLAQSILSLNSKIKDLESNFYNAQNEICDLKVKNEQLIKQKDFDYCNIEELRKKLESREEQFLELQQKLDLKTKECEYFSSKLQETQTQLTSSVIKIKQLTVGESPTAAVQVNEVQSENMNLRHKIQDLERCIEILNKEKEESSQSFHAYAQQCNAQISSLSSEVRNLTKENQQLQQKNKILEKNSVDVLYKESGSKPIKEHTDLINLNNKLSQLTEENKQLHIDVKEKTDEIESLINEKKNTMAEMDQIHSTLLEIRSENLKLLQEKETANSSQKLLAAMESDKVAAARAMSQNQTLKKQVAELEEGFIKLSHEKLKLTDELSHEKHLQKELESRLRELESSLCKEHKHNDHSDEHSKSANTINESADVEELKNIIRQLEEDKTELLSRLNSDISSKNISHLNETIEREGLKNSESHHEEHICNDMSENSKLLLQQMEEKVKKTMNEIAALDEEKEKLEHLVLQLQSETETIGEYISLYQTQRMLLRQRNKEKDDQLLQLTKDKEDLKAKLITLNDLVNHLLNKNARECDIIHVSETTEKCLPEDVPRDTVAKIQNLISEIQSTNLIANQTIAFEHCPCCSGRLITI